MSSGNFREDPMVFWPMLMDQNRCCLGHALILFGSRGPTFRLHWPQQAAWRITLVISVDCLGSADCGNPVNQRGQQFLLANCTPTRLTRTEAMTRRLGKILVLHAVHRPFSSNQSQKQIVQGLVRTLRNSIEFKNLEDTGLGIPSVVGHLRLHWQTRTSSSYFLKKHGIFGSRRPKTNLETGVFQYS